MHSPHRCISFVSYIKPQPCNLVPISATGCISFVSYIKPQLRCRSLGSHRVVYLLFPTSNHNPRSCAWRCFRLYIFCFLHQTTTLVLLCLLPLSCISFVSYIKPQLIDRTKRTNKVVYLLFPTSNHNASSVDSGSPSVVYLLFPTSNHNGRTFSNLQIYVVYLLFPTSNHNLIKLSVKDSTVVYLLFPTSNHNFSNICSR